MKVAQSCLTLCNPMDYTVHGVLQARTLEWVAFSFYQGFFPTQELNPGLLRCRRILYQLSHKGSPIGLAMPSLNGKYYDKVYIIGVHHLMGSIFISSKLWNICTHKKYTNIIKSTDGLSEGENRQNRLHLESRTPSWAGLWTLSYMPSIYGSDIPTGKSEPPDGRAPGLIPRLCIA